MLATYRSQSGAQLTLSSSTHQSIADDSTSILLIGIEKVVQNSMAGWFLRNRFRIGTAEDMGDALRQLQPRRWDIILVDTGMPGLDYRVLQKQIRAGDHPTAVILIGSCGPAEMAVRSPFTGTCSRVPKPVNPHYLAHVIGNAIEQHALFDENLALKKCLSGLPALDEIVGESPALREVSKLIELVSKTDATVMIHGEDGTEKEVIAREIHRKSERRFFPRLTVHCGLVSGSQLRSELFGFPRKALDGRIRYTKGMIELAHRGTLFLDEIGSIDLKTQGAILSAIESGLSRREGGWAANADVRIICATSSDLGKAKSTGAFREDLYYRLNVFSILLPPLRERKSDIPLLANYFAVKHARGMGKPPISVSPAAMDALMRHDWPGNVRELENAIERAVIVCEASAIQVEDLPYHFSFEIQASHTRSLASKQKMHIVSILEQNDWNISRSAEVLEIDRVTLYKKIQRYRIKRP